MDKLIPSAVVALAVSLLAFFGLSTVSAPNTDVTALPGAQVVEEYLGGLSGVVLESPYVFKNGVGAGGDFLTVTANGQIRQGQNQASWRNNTGRTVFIDTATMFPSGVASTTFIYYVGTSTAATYSNNYAAPYATLVDGHRVATSSAPIVINNTKHAGTNGRTIISVDPGVYVNFAVLQGYLQGNCTGSVCEAATSTNRGFSTVDWYLKGHFKP